VKSKSGESMREIESGYSQNDSISDVCQLTGKSIVFFMITQEEFDSAMAKTKDDYEGHDLNENIADFDSYVHVITNKLVKTDIKAIRVRNRYFSIPTSKGNELFDRKKNNKLYGVILSDGIKAPLIKEGIIFTEDDYKKMIKEYFGVDIPN
jgi:hypothetical protein